ncbi:MAG TPA: Holliday junction branch migration protein RuvA [Ignavibacteriaceae bacterium]|jgi:Holliday junction DNA helicase RuvA|nr:Holliday junction branch migration protein RuvA [Ignavibacteriaceae bacterium]HOJ17210.1 Holliday junction branch migration protein RuvA [Ignavibacteriaceae bacterium]
MIAYLKGGILSKKPGKIILDVNGVGYLVLISANTFDQIAQLDSVELFIHTAVKEDSITLFGFKSENEKMMFELLISVNGVGPKTALGILSGINVDDLKRAIISSDLNRISMVPGIGKKLAERLVIELKSKIDMVYEEPGQKRIYSGRSEAISALTALGFNFKNVELVIKEISINESDLSAEELIKKALSRLSSK